jgi:hypothetical protein
MCSAGFGPQSTWPASPVRIRGSSVSLFWQVDKEDKQERANRWGFKCTIYAFTPSSVRLRLPRLADLRLTLAMAVGRMVTSCMDNMAAPSLPLALAPQSPLAVPEAAPRDPVHKLLVMDLDVFAGGRDSPGPDADFVAALRQTDGVYASAQARRHAAADLDCPLQPRHSGCAHGHGPRSKAGRS